MCVHVRSYAYTACRWPDIDLHLIPSIRTKRLAPVAGHHGDMPPPHALAHVAAPVAGAPAAPARDLTVHDGMACLDVLHGAQAGRAVARGGAVDLAHAVAQPLVVALRPLRPEAPSTVLSYNMLEGCIWCWKV